MLKLLKIQGFSWFFLQNSSFSRFFPQFLKFKAFQVFKGFLLKWQPCKNSNLKCFLIRLFEIFLNKFFILEL